MLTFKFGGQETRPVDTAACRGAPEQGLFTTSAQKTTVAFDATAGAIGTA